MVDYQKLYSYLSYFEKITGNDTNNLMEEKSLFYISYEEKINEFVKCFSELEFKDYAYTDTLSEHGITSVEEMAVKIPTADAGLLKAIMTKMIREERFSTGAIAAYAKDGLFEQALRRLGELYGYDC